MILAMDCDHQIWAGQKIKLRWSAQIIIKTYCGESSLFVDTIYWLQSNFIQDSNISLVNFCEIF